MKEGTPDQLAHHGLIKLLVEDALHTYTIPLSWEIFRNMSKDDDIRILVKELTSSSSEEREHIEAEEKSRGKETLDKPPQKEQEEKQGKGQVDEPKIVGGTKGQTLREKRLQSRAERTEKVQASEDTTKTTTAKLKGNAPPAKQTKTMKIVSTGSQKIVNTGLSTGSLEIGQQKEKLPEILAKEAAAVLATLSTSPKKKGK